MAPRCQLENFQMDKTLTLWKMDSPKGRELRLQKKGIARLLLLAIKHHKAAESIATQVEAGKQRAIEHAWRCGQALNKIKPSESEHRSGNRFLSARIGNWNGIIHRMATARGAEYRAAPARNRLCRQCPAFAARLLSRPREARVT